MAVRGEGYRLHTRHFEASYTNMLISNDRDFPKSLGPFLPMQTVLDDKTLKIDHEALTWTCSDKIVQPLKKLYDTIQGRISTVSSVTLLGQALKGANIPADATHFCFLYPLTPPDDFAQRIDKGLTGKINYIQPEVSFLTAGGFVYFDENNKVVRVNAFRSHAAGTLQLDLARQWNPSYTKLLGDKARFVPVATFTSGHKWMTWLAPNEIRTSGKPICPHGGFLFLAHHVDDPNPCPSTVAQNCFFGVVGSEKNVSVLNPEDEVYEFHDQIRHARQASLFEAHLSPKGMKHGNDIIEIVRMPTSPLTLYSTASSELLAD